MSPSSRASANISASAPGASPTTPSSRTIRAHLRGSGHRCRARRDRSVRGRIGANKNLIVPRDASNRLLAPTTLIDRAHRKRLIVHGWTFRNENTFLPADFRQGNPASATYLHATGDAPGAYGLFYGLGIDGLFSDPDTAVAARLETFEKGGKR